MLSNVDILNAIKSGDLYVEPFNEKNLKPNALSMHLDNEFAIPIGGEVDPVEKQDIGDNYEIITIENNEKFLLTPGEFILGRTLERVSLSNKYGMVIEGRSTLARLGISVTQTAMVVEAGHGVKGGKRQPRKIVLEIANVGPFNVYLTPEMRIAKVALFKLDTPSNISYDDMGRYGHKEVPDDLLPVLGE